MATSGQIGPKFGWVNEGFIYALSAVEIGLSFAVSPAANSRPLSCRFKCPCPPRWQRHFYGNADRAYNTLHFASQSRVPRGCPLWNPQQQNGDMLPTLGAYRRLLSAARFTVCV